MRLLVINENVGGLKYCSARGEIQRPLQDYLMRKQLCPRHFCQSGTKVGTITPFVQGGTIPIN